eukprot:167393-Pelagomonas_calceolata.AAC.2
MGVWWRRVGEGESAHPGAWPSTLQIPGAHYNTTRSFFFFIPELLDLQLAGVDQPQADQLNSLAEGLPI